MTIDYIILFLFFVVALVAVFLARKTVLDYKKIEEDRKDARQDRAKQNEQILKQMQNQHEIDMLRIEASAQNGGADLMTLVQTVLPILLSTKNADITASAEPTLPATKSETEVKDGESVTDVEIDSEKTGQEVISNSPVESGESVSDSASERESQPKTLMRQWVDSPDSDSFFEIQALNEMMDVMVWQEDFTADVITSGKFTISAAAASVEVSAEDTEEAA